MKSIYEQLDMPEGSDFEALKVKYEELKALYGEQRFKAGEEGSAGAQKLGELEESWNDFCEARQAEEQAKHEAENYSQNYAYIEQMVREKKYDEAQARLDSITNRDGAWHYHQALVYYKREWMNECYKHLREAVKLSPENTTYRDSLTKMTQVLGSAKTPPSSLGANGEGTQTGGSAAGNCLNSCCTTLCCMECLMMPFRCCGG